MLEETACMDNMDEKNRKKGCNKLITVKKTIKQ